MQADAHIPVRLSTPELDLCCILGNLDNAIDAVLPLPPDERIIRIYMDMKGSQLYISLYELYRAEKREKRSPGACHHEGRGPRARAYAGGCDSGTAGRIFKQKFRRTEPLQPKYCCLRARSDFINIRREGAVGDKAALFCSSSPK